MAKDDRVEQERAREEAEFEEPGHALTNVIDVYINLLRRKVERPGQRPLIHTLRGVGYSLRDEPCA